MRIHPATGFILERLVPPGGTYLSGVFLPENTVVGANSWVMHHNKSIFGEDVDVFRPEIWLEGSEAQEAEMQRCMIAVSAPNKSLYPYLGVFSPLLRMIFAIFGFYEN